MGTTFTQGQLAQLGSIVNIGTATALPNVAAKYDPKILLKALDGRGEIFAGHLEVALEQVFNNMIVLVPKGTTVITLAKRHDPDAFYRTRSGLYVYDDFRSRVVAKARPSEVGTTLKVECTELMQDSTDEEIERALPKNHIFDESQVCTVVSGLIAKQADGEEGILLNTGYANLFYTSSCLVGVSWDAGSHKWYVDTWQRGGDGWDAGDRAFSPAN